jgi:hypothetical protein
MATVKREMRVEFFGGDERAVRDSPRGAGRRREFQAD